MADRIKGITVVLGGDTTGLNKALSGTNKEIKNTQAQLKDVERLLKLDPTNTTLLEQKQRLLADAVGETKTKLDTLKTAEKQVQDQFKRGEVSQQQYDALKREIVATEAQLDELEEKAKTSNVVLQQIGQVAADIGTGAEKMSAGLNSMKTAATVASAAVIASGVGVVNTISDMDEALSQFVSRTGLASSSTEYWRESLEQIYKDNYGDNFLDIADAMTVVKNQIGALDASELTNLTESAFALRDVFGYDISESVRAAKTLMDNFGIDGSRAFDLIALGAQNGLDYSGELLDTINEYSVQFGKLGYDAEGMFTVLDAGAKSGALNLDKVGDAMKEFSIRAIDGSDTTVAGFEAIGLSSDEMSQKFAEGGDIANQAFGQVIDALKSIDDPIARNTAGINLFGTMWEDLGEEAILSLTGITEAAYGTTGALDQIKETRYGNLISEIQSLGKTAQTDILVPLGEQLLPMLSSLVTTVSGLVSQFSNLSSGQQQAILAVAGLIAVLPTLITLFSGVFTVIGTVSTGIALFTGAATTGSAAATGISIALKGISTVAGGIGTALSSLGTLITGTVIPAITSSVSGLFAFLAANPVVLIITGITAAVIALVALIATKGDEIQAILQKVDDFLQGIFLTDWTKIFGPGLGDALNAFFANVKNIWNAVKQIFDGVIDFIRGVFTGDWERAWNGVKSIFSGIFNGLTAIVKAPINGIIGLLNGAIGGINGLIGGLNKISFSLPSWVPGVGGKSFGINIPYMGKIPYLAKGGILSQGSAIVGEAGPELLTMMGSRAMVQPLTSQQKTTNVGGINMYIYGAPGQDINELADIVEARMETKYQQKAAVYRA